MSIISKVGIDIRYQLYSGAQVGDRSLRTHGSEFTKKHFPFLPQTNQEESESRRDDERTYRVLKPTMRGSSQWGLITNKYRIRRGRRELLIIPNYKPDNWGIHNRLVYPEVKKKNRSIT